MSPSCTSLSAFIAISRFSRTFVCFLVKNDMPDSSSFIDFTPLLFSSFIPFYNSILNNSIENNARYFYLFFNIFRGTNWKIQLHFENKFVYRNQRRKQNAGGACKHAVFFVLRGGADNKRHFMQKI